MSNMLEHAKSELARLSGDGEHDEMQEAMNAHILGMVKLFSEEGHSGFSAAYAVGALTKLLRFQPLTPLTGDDDEWVEHSPDNFQNRRCSHVFKDGKDAPAYDIDGKVFREPNGVCFTSYDSRVPVTFPYTPTTQYVDVPARAYD